MYTHIVAFPRWGHNWGNYIWRCISKVADCDFYIIILVAAWCKFVCKKLTEHNAKHSNAFTWVFLHFNVMSFWQWILFFATSKDYLKFKSIISFSSSLKKNLGNRNRLLIKNQIFKFQTWSSKKTWTLLSIT